MEIKNRLVKYSLASMVFSFTAWVILRDFIKNLVTKDLLDFEVIISFILSSGLLYALYVVITGLILEIKKYKEATRNN